MKLRSSCLHPRRASRLPACVIALLVCVSWRVWSAPQPLRLAQLSAPSEAELRIQQRAHESAPQSAVHKRVS